MCTSNVRTFNKNKRTFVALNMNSFVRFKPNDKGKSLIKHSPIHFDEFNIHDDGFYECPMHLFVQAFGADVGCSNAYVEGNTMAIELGTQVVEPESNEPLVCDLCDYNFEEKKDYDKLYHFSGVLNGKHSKHIHACENCVKEHELDQVVINTKEEEDG